MNALSGIYGQVARARRAWYQPHRQRRLAKPVISVGNLVVGGSGKTPAVAAVVRLLQQLGERPAILSRGYARRSSAPLVVVSEGRGPAVSVEESGDEPQMLARALPDVPLVVCADRYHAGRWVESHLSPTVHVLDDGFQHVQLARDIDMLLVSSADLDEAVLPAGRLREPVASAVAADVVLVPGAEAERHRVTAALNVQAVFSLRPSLGPLRRVHPFGSTEDATGGRVVAVAGIARPERFFESLTVAGIDVAERMTFRDHHWFSADDVQRIEESAQRAGVSLVVTTEKDAVRLEPLLARSSPTAAITWMYQPYLVQIEPQDAFREWLADRLRAARATSAAGRQ